MSNVLNAVYNNYLTTYAPKSLTRYDTHKKSELRGVYNSIVKQNKDAPWYLPTTSKDVQHYAVDLKENARELYNNIAQFGGLEQESILNKKSAFSSNEDIATVSYMGEDAPEGLAPSYNMEVRSLASPQENIGLFLDDTRVALRPDTYSFDVSINDMNYEFQFTVGENETNKEVQSRLMRLVNNSGIGIKASLIESEGKTALRMTSESTGLALGKAAIFRVSDDRTSKTAGTVEYFGLDYMSREPANARFLLNGEERVTSSNRFTIGKMFDVELKGVTAEDESIQIGLKADTDSLTDNVSRLIGGYNTFMKAISDYLGFQSNSNNLIKEMKDITSRHSSSLETLGLNMTQDGTLQLQPDLLRETVSQSKDVSETFSPLKDFSNSLLRKSTQISLNPMDYVDKTVVAYKRPGGPNYVSPYNTSAYSGMMFNSYC